MGSEEQPLEPANTCFVRRQAIANTVYPPGFTRRGVKISVILPGGNSVYEKKLWQRGVWLPFRPFYARRVERVTRKAQRIADSLSA